MTQVPFRCVDEINQGMDERNEKMVWKLLVETAKNHSAQFFYLAPKFPQQLQFDEHMNIHVCYNGDLNLGKDKDAMDVDDIIETLRTKRGKKRKKN
jgi:hypothetical protein